MSFFITGMEALCWEITARVKWVSRGNLLVIRSAHFF